MFTRLIPQQQVLWRARCTCCDTTSWCVWCYRRGAASAKREPKHHSLYSVFSRNRYTLCLWVLHPPSTMRARDIGVSVVAVTAAFLALQGTPDVDIQLHW